MNETPTASAPTPFPLSEWIQQIVPEVFQTMVTLEVTPALSKLAPATTDRIVGAIGLGGESVSGAIYLQLTAPLADEVTSLLLGMGKDEKPSDADVNDAIGELCKHDQRRPEIQPGQSRFPLRDQPARDRPRHLLFRGGSRGRCS